jgi:hypothetical protein
VQATGLELGCLAAGFRVGRCVICDGCLEGLAVGLRVGFEVVGASVGEKDTVGIRVIVGATVGLAVGRSEGGAVASLFLVCTDGADVGSGFAEVLKRVGDAVGRSVIVLDDTGDAVGWSVLGLFGAGDDVGVPSRARASSDGLGTAVLIAPPAAPLEVVGRTEGAEDGGVVLNSCSNAAVTPLCPDSKGDSTPGIFVSAAFNWAKYFSV